jgi:hypothetical protein
MYYIRDIMKRKTPKNWKIMSSVSISPLWTFVLKNVHNGGLLAWKSPHKEDAPKSWNARRMMSILVRVLIR